MSMPLSFAVALGALVTILTQGARELPPIPPRQNGQRGKVAKSDAHNLWERMKNYETAVLRFAKHPDVAFTNNRAERDLRMAKVKQKVSGCFRIREKLLENLERAVTKKIKKIRGRRSDFDTWWLVLVDRVFSTESFTFDGTNEGKRLLRSMRCIAQRLAITERSWPWSRIIALAPPAPCCGYDLTNPQQ